MSYITFTKQFQNTKSAMRTAAIALGILGVALLPAGVVYADDANTVDVREQKADTSVTVCPTPTTNDEFWAIRNKMPKSDWDLANGSVTIRNDNDCAVPTALKSFKVNNEDPQQGQTLFDTDEVLLAPGQTRHFSVEVPSCRYQLDAVIFPGEPWMSGRLIKGEINFSLPVCSQPQQVSCPLTPTGDDILLDLTQLPGSAVQAAPEKIISNATVNHAKRGPANIAVPAGTYKVTLTAYDDHSEPNQGDQIHEQYRLDFMNGSNQVLASSGATGDLPDAQQYITTVVNQALAIPSGATKLRAFHAAYPDTSTTNSIEPVCALLRPVDTPEPPQLTLIKKVINDDGGTKGEFDFKLFVDTEKTIAPQEFPIQLTSQETITLRPGTYTIYEETLPGYTPEGWTGQGCTGVDAITGKVELAAGQHVICTITNNDVPEDATVITVFKKVINNDGGTAEPTDFEFFLTPTDGRKMPDIPLVHNVPTQVPAGSYRAYEIEKSGYIASDWGGDCDTDGNITLQAGDNKSCTITNDDTKIQSDKTNVSIDKSVDKHEGQPGDVFTYTLTYSNTTNIDAHDVTLIDTMFPADIISSPTILQQPIDNDPDDDDGVCTIVQTKIGSSDAATPQNKLVCDLGDNTIPTDGGTLEGGVTGTIKYQITVTEPGTVHNDVEIKTSDMEVDPPGTTDNFDEEDVVVANTDVIDLTVEKLVRNKKDDTSGKSASGSKTDSFIYTLTYRNLGQKGATDVVLRDEVAVAGVVKIVEITQQPPHSKKMVSDACKVINDGLGIECQLGDLEGLAVGTLEYKADAIDVGTTPNTAFIDPDDTIAEENENNNTDDARVTVTTNAPQADVTIAKSVTPGGGEPGTVFTYTLAYENIGNIDAENVTIDDDLVEQGFLNNFEVTKDPEHGTCNPIDEDKGNLHCDLGLLKVGESGTIKYTATGVKNGTDIKNIAIIRTDTPETIDENDDPTNNIDDALIDISSGGGSSSGGSSGGSSGRRRPNTVLFSEPEVAGVSLVAVPYTGVGDIVQIILYFLVLAGVAGGATYALFKYRKNRAGKQFNLHMEKAAETITTRPVTAPRSPLASSPAPAVNASVVTPEPEHIVASEQGIEKDDSASKAFDMRAQAMKVLISSDGKDVIAQSADNDQHKMVATLERVVGEAEKKFPREDGWLLLNRTRVEEILFSKSLSTVPLFVQWLVQGNQRQIFSFVRSLSQQGRSPEEFIQQVVAALDAVYRSRVDGIDTHVDQNVSELVEKLSREELEAMITNLTRGIDGGYRSVLDGVKVAVTRIMNERMIQSVDSVDIPEASHQKESKTTETSQSVDHPEN